jgi:hypothetical protein
MNRSSTVGAERLYRLNPTERLWQHTRRTGTHSRYFASGIELETTLERVFGDMQHHPAIIRAYLLPFC